MRCYNTFQANACYFSIILEIRKVTSLKSMLSVSKLSKWREKSLNFSKIIQIFFNRNNVYMSETVLEKVYCNCRQIESVFSYVTPPIDISPKIYLKPNNSKLFKLANDLYFNVFTGHQYPLQSIIAVAKTQSVWFMTDWKRVNYVGTQRSCVTLNSTTNVANTACRRIWNHVIFHL